jgi:hypothetical protein
MRESLILKQIGDWLDAKHHFWMRLGTGSIVLGEGKHRVFRGHNLGPGCADILVLKHAPFSKEIPGRMHVPIWIECKNENGKQSPAQVSFAQMVEQLGHMYVVARSIDDLDGVL